MSTSQRSEGAFVGHIHVETSRSPSNLPIPLAALNLGFYGGYWKTEEDIMTESDQPNANEPPPEPTAASEIQESAKNMMGQLGTGERLIAIGALLILVICWLIGTLLLDDYGLSNISVLIPIGVLAAMYFYYNGKTSAWHSLYGTIVKVGSWAMAIIALYALIDDTLITSNRYEGATFFYELVFIAAGILFGVGAWQMRSDDR
jgi:hypothetical protein